MTYIYLFYVILSASQIQGEDKGHAKDGYARHTAYRIKMHQKNIFQIMKFPIW